MTQHCAQRHHSRVCAGITTTVTSPVAGGTRHLVGHGPQRLKRPEPSLNPLESRLLAELSQEHRSAEAISRIIDAGTLQITKYHRHIHGAPADRGGGCARRAHCRESAGCMGLADRSGCVFRVSGGNGRGSHWQAVPGCLAGCDWLPASPPTFFSRPPTPPPAPRLLSSHR